MPRNVLASFLVLSLFHYAHADYESAKEAFDTGDYETAYQELLPLVETGDVRAENSLAWHYLNGLGIEQDYVEAETWFRKAAAQGYAKAQYNLGVMYVHGDGVRQDYAEGIKWFRKAAEQDDADAQYYLGVLYVQGLGVTKDYAEGIKWMSKATDQGVDDAQTDMVAMCSKLIWEACAELTRKAMK